MSCMKFADIDEMCSEDTNLKREDISKLTEWQIMQPHLPPPIHPMETVLFLQRCSYSIEEAKDRIDTFYTFRTKYRELFTNINPHGAELQLGLNIFLVTPLPDFTPEGYIVIYGHLVDTNLDVYNFNTLVKMIDMISSLSVMQRGCHRGIVAVINVEGTTLAHVLKWNAMTMKIAATYVQRVAPVRFKSIHFVNCVPIMDKIVALINPLLSKAFNKKVFLHYGDNTTIYKYLSKKMLPIECGGESFCANEYFKNVTRPEVESHWEYFKRAEGQLVDETKRPHKQEFDLDIFGVDGTFKKLVID